MESNAEGNLLEIMDLARTLRQEQLFIQQEQAAFIQLTEALSENSTSITKLSYICAQQRKNLNDLIISRPESGPLVCCRRAKGYDNAKFIEAKRILDYEIVLAYEDLFNFLYRSPYLLAVALATGDRLPDISNQHINSVIHTITVGLYGNAINTKDVEMILQLLRELIDIQILVCEENPKRVLQTNGSSFGRLYQRLNESLFSAKIFLMAALYQPIMSVLSETDTMLTVDPNKVLQNFTVKEKIKRFGSENSDNYRENVEKFHLETIDKLYQIAEMFIDSLYRNWSLFPSTLRWLIQTMCHQLKQAHRFTDRIITEVITDLVFTHFICPAIINPDIMGIVDVSVSEAIRFNLMQIAQIIQTMALSKYTEPDVKYAEVHAKFERNLVPKLLELLLESGQCGEDVVAILAQQSEFERTHWLATQTELTQFIEFFRILLTHHLFEIGEEERNKLEKILANMPENAWIMNGHNENSHCNAGDITPKDRAKVSIINLSKATKSKLAKTISFNQHSANEIKVESALTSNGIHNGLDYFTSPATSNHSNCSVNSNSNSPLRTIDAENNDSIEPILLFNLYTGSENKLQPLSEEEVLKMNSIGQEIANEELVDGENYQIESTVDKSSVVNGFGGIDGISDVLRTQHNKNSRFSLSHDDASIGNSDNLEVVSEVPSNHSVSSSLELEENDQNDNLSDMVSANVSGRGTPNISGRDTPSSQVTDAGSLPTPQMQKLISKARSDIEDKFCKFEIKKFVGDETVSVISDTWSTDVLASDTETVPEDRDRERNFSTPLIPAAVVLPGDNNFDVLTGSGVVQTGYLDISDQRSESNWSTDVLASDSEKLNEIDTDDNVSIAARSDTTDGGVRFVHERDQLAAAISAPCGRQRTSIVPHYSMARTSRGLRMANSSTTGHKPIVANHRNSDDVMGSGSSGGNASDRSQEDCAFYDAINSYEDTANRCGNNSHTYSGVSSLARSSMRTTNQMGGENTFQQNYKSIGLSNDERNSYLANSEICRQTSSGNDTENQNLLQNPETAFKKSPQNAGSVESKDLIDFTDFCDVKNFSTPPTTEVPPLPLVDISSNNEEVVIRRPLSTEQRSTGFDGRRNAIMALKVGYDSSSGINSLTPSLRKHQSLNYENHEIMIAASIPKRISANPNLSFKPIEKEEKKFQPNESQAQETLCDQTEKLHLDDNFIKPLNPYNIGNHNEITVNNIEVATHNTVKNNTSNISSTGILTPSTSLSQKPNKSTGAIPKSISFDSSADKTSLLATEGNASSSVARMRSSRCQEDSRRHGNASVLNASSSHNNSSIFNKLKQGIFKHRRNHKPLRHQTNSITEDVPQSSRTVSFSNNTSEVSLDLIGTNGNSIHERSIDYYDVNEDILAKYRRKVSTSSEATNSSIGNGVCAGIGIGASTEAAAGATSMALDGAINRISRIIQDPQQGQAHSINNKLHANVAAPDKAMAFTVIKRKIRTVFSKTDLHSADFRHTTHPNSSPLLTYLQIQLAQAINLQNFQQISYVSEAIRCIASLEREQHTQLLQELQNDVQKRQNYLQYLMRYRQQLLLMIENMEQYEARLKNESNTCCRYLMAACIRLFIEKRENQLETFQDDFTQLTASDDKIDYIEEFINCLINELTIPGGILYRMPDWLTFEARISLERVLLQRVYQQVMFPNEDADLSRDKVFFEHIRKLQKIITPSHAALCIPLEYLDEAPWTFAQEQLSYISAYKTPREKLLCVIRCISSIMSLLQMSTSRTPAADDILPVLIYVVIMVNPPYLLSTVGYISCFIGKKMSGEEQFHWTLFGSVVDFIKTMD